MHNVQLRGVRISPSMIIDDAVRGEPGRITRHGPLQAVIHGDADWRRLSHVSSFGR